MKIAVISDIHGNFPALQAVLKDIEAEGVDQIYCLGDLVGYYCMIDEVIDTIRERKIPAIMGNHDFALCHTGGVIERSKTCTRILGRQLQEIRADNRTWLYELPGQLEFQLGNVSFYCVHGGLGDPVDEYIKDIDEDYFNRHGFTHDVLISGHTHQLRNEKAGKFTYLNPGSVGQPRDGNPAAAYMLLTESAWWHKRVVYEVDRVADAMKEKGYEPYIYEILYRGVKIGG